MIPVIDLKAQYRNLRSDIDAAVHAVLENADFILGAAVQKLERDVAALCRTSHAIGVASGTDALCLALHALGVGPRDEVITTPFTFIGTASPIVRCGARPVFVDIDPHTLNLDVELLRPAIGPRTKAILPVHLFGLPANMDAILRIARESGLFVIEDCAQAIGATYCGQAAGSLGHLGCLSFFPTKNLGGAGDGGMVVTNDAALADKVDMLRRQGCKRKYFAESSGYNSRLDTLQAAVLSVKLPHLAAWNQRRRELARVYDDLLADVPVVKPASDPGHVYHQYTIRTPRRDALAAHLHAKGVGTMVYYPTALHCQPAFVEFGYAAGSLPISERAAAEVLSLPMFPELTDSQVEQVVSAIKDFFRS